MKIYLKKILPLFILVALMGVLVPQPLSASFSVSEADLLLNYMEKCLPTKEEADSDKYYNLASYYYFDTKDYKNAVIWALKGAELGSSNCMYLLRKAYVAGDGVIKDTAEGFKWLILSVSMENRGAREDLALFGKMRASLKSSDPDHPMWLAIDEEWNESIKRARNWRQKHRNLFINPN